MFHGMLEVSCSPRRGSLLTAQCSLHPIVACAVFQTVSLYEQHNLHVDSRLSSLLEDLHKFDPFYLFVPWLHQTLMTTASMASKPPMAMPNRPCSISNPAIQYSSCARKGSSTTRLVPWPRPHQTTLSLLWFTPLASVAPMCVLPTRQRHHTTAATFSNALISSSRSIIGLMARSAISKSSNPSS